MRETMTEFHTWWVVELEGDDPKSSAQDALKEFREIREQRSADIAGIAYLAEYYDAIECGLKALIDNRFLEPITPKKQL